MDQQFLQADCFPDKELVARILAGEKKLFEFIIRRYNQRLFRIGMSILNDDAETEDAMQTSYVNAYEHLGSFENRSSLGTWLTRIMLNECLRQKNRKQRLGIEMNKQSQTKNNMTTPVSILANKELSSALESAVAQLPEKYRMVFVLREIEEMSVKETSEALNIEQPNVKVRLNRAKLMLRDSLKDYAKTNVYNFHLTRCDLMVANVFNRLSII